MPYAADINYINYEMDVFISGIKRDLEESLPTYIYI